MNSKVIVKQLFNERVNLKTRTEQTVCLKVGFSDSLFHRHNNHWITITVDHAVSKAVDQ